MKDEKTPECGEKCAIKTSHQESEIKKKVTQEKFAEKESTIKAEINKIEHEKK